MKILHVTYHTGCSLNINYVCKKLNHSLETQFANWNYNIGYNRANEVWSKYKDYYNSFDIVITSDTAPLSRIFLQNNFSKKLIVWICNRFDYYDGATNDCNFPDLEYYKLLKSSLNKENVKFVSYTKFEYEYALKYRNIDFGNLVIKPCSFAEASTNNLLLNNIDKKNTFFIPNYHNDSIFMDLHKKCNDLNINSYRGRYNGPLDLENFKGIIHIPYAWSNLALFENWSIGNVYLIPSKKFILELKEKPNLYWTPPFPTEYINSSEWYLPEHEDLFIYFDSWDHLKYLANDNKLIEAKKNKIREFSIKNNDTQIEKWKSLLY